jgi:hypothetical protein
MQILGHSGRDIEPTGSLRMHSLSLSFFLRQISEIAQPQFSLFVVVVAIKDSMG